MVKPRLCLLMTVFYLPPRGNNGQHRHAGPGAHSLQRGHYDGRPLAHRGGLPQRRCTETQVPRHRGRVRPLLSGICHRSIPTVHLEKKNLAYIQETKEVDHVMKPCSPYFIQFHLLVVIFGLQCKYRYFQRIVEIFEVTVKILLSHSSNTYS